MVRRRSVVFGMAAICLALSSCGAPESSSGAESVPSAESSVLAEGGQAPQSLLARTVSLVNGESFDLGQAIAERPVVLWFWAPG